MKYPEDRLAFEQLLSNDWPAVEEPLDHHADLTIRTVAEAVFGGPPERIGAYKPPPGHDQDKRIYLIEKLSSPEKEAWILVSGDWGGIAYFVDELGGSLGPGDAYARFVVNCDCVVVLALGGLPAEFLTAVPTESSREAERSVGPAGFVRGLVNGCSRTDDHRTMFLTASIRDSADVRHAITDEILQVPFDAKNEGESLLALRDELLSLGVEVHRRAEWVQSHRRVTMFSTPVGRQNLMRPTDTHDASLPSTGLLSTR